jgi:hypothetical protein
MYVHTVCTVLVPISMYVLYVQYLCVHANQNRIRSGYPCQPLSTPVSVLRDRPQQFTGHSLFLQHSTILSPEVAVKEFLSPPFSRGWSEEVSIYGSSIPWKGGGQHLYLCFQLAGHSSCGLHMQGPHTMMSSIIRVYRCTHPEHLHTWRLTNHKRWHHALAFPVCRPPYANPFNCSII